MANRALSTFHELETCMVKRNVNLQSSAKYVGKIRKSSKVRQDQRTLISVFAYFLSPSPKLFFSVGDTKY